MMRSFLLGAGCVLFFAQAVIAEGEKIRRLGFGVGLSLVRNKDNAASPFAYGGTDQSLMLRYDYRDQKKQRYHVLSFATGELESSISNGQNHIQKSYLLYTRDAYHRVFRTNSDGRFRFFWGGVHQAFINVRRQFYIRGLREFFGEIAWNIQPSFQVVYQRKPDSFISYQISIPAVTLLWRHSYSLGGNIAFQVATPNQFLGFNHYLNWTHRLSGRWYLQVQYWGQFYRYDKPRPVKLGRDQVSALIAWAL